MQIAVISDLHLGRGDATDQFGHDDAEFLRFLDFLERNFERVVLLGDIYESLTSPLPMVAASELERCRRAHPEIARRFDTDRYLYVHGNHDIVAGRTRGAPSHVSLQVDGQRLLFTHGHHHDTLIRHARWLSELAIWLGGWMLRAGLAPVWRLVDRMDLMLRSASTDAERCSFQRWAIALAHERAADIVVTGHTHVGCRAEHGDRLFLNSGSCAGGETSFLAIDTRAGDYRLCAGW